MCTRWDVFFSATQRNVQVLYARQRACAFTKKSFPWLPDWIEKHTASRVLWYKDLCMQVHVNAICPWEGDVMRYVCCILQRERERDPANCQCKAPLSQECRSLWRLTLAGCCCWVACEMLSITPATQHNPTPAHFTTLWPARLFLLSCPLPLFISSESSVSCALFRLSVHACKRGMEGMWLPLCKRVLEHCAWEWAATQ